MGCVFSQRAIFLIIQILDTTVKYSLESLIFFFWNGCCNDNLKGSRVILSLLKVKPVNKNDYVGIYPPMQLPLFPGVIDMQ